MGSALPTGWEGPQEEVAVSPSPEFEAAGVLAAYPESTSPGSGGRCPPAAPLVRPVQTAPTTGEKIA